MLKKTVVAVLALAVTLAFSPLLPINAAPSLAGKPQVGESLVELAAKKKKKKAKAGKCGTFMYYSKKKCVDARDKK